MLLVTRMPQQGAQIKQYSLYYSTSSLSLKGVVFAFYVINNCFLFSNSSCQWSMQSRFRFYVPKRVYHSQILFSTKIFGFGANVFATKNATLSTNSNAPDQHKSCYITKQLPCFYHASFPY